MNESKTAVDQEVHKKLASELFNSTWELIEKADRTEEEDEKMVHAAHASRFHWGVVGTPLHFALGEWQISRVYALVGRPEPALYHARKTLQLSVDNQLGDFHIGFAYESLARAYGVMDDTSNRDENISLAKESAERVAKEGDKQWLLKNINTVASLTLPIWGEN